MMVRGREVVTMPEARSPKIEFADVSLVYHDGSQTNEVLHAMNFSVAPGEFVSIIGASGCGKSTTLSILAGLQEPSSGHFYIDGRESHGTGRNRGVVFQHYALFPWMTAKANVAFGARQAQPDLASREAGQRACEYLSRVGLAGAENRYPYQMSGGMQQRTAIARLLAMSPEILLLDEPFGAVDAKNRMQLQDLLQELLLQEQRRKTIVLVTHDIDEAILLSDRVFFMDKQKIAEEFTVPFARPRRREQIVLTEAYRQLSQSILSCFFRTIGEQIGGEEVVI